MKGKNMKHNYRIFKTFLILIILLIYSESNSQMYWNQACNFNGGSDSSHVSVRNSSSLDITGSFTLEAWVNPSNVASPSFQIIIQKRNTASDGYTLYLSNGKVAMRTNASTRLTGKQVISNNTWTHIAGIYNSATNTFSTYINGILDTSAVIAAAQPVSNNDSVWIGKGFNSPFAGLMDEVRIWNKALSSTEVFNYRRTSLGSDTGPYSGLVLSITFQDNDDSGPPFTLFDWSSNGNSGINRNVSAYDMSNRPLQTIQTNDCIELDGASDFLTGPDNSYVSPTSQITLSAWIYMRTAVNSVIIHKGLPTGGGGTNYRLGINGRKLSGGINGIFVTSDDTIPLNKWTYVAFSYNSAVSYCQFHINGNLVYQGDLFAGPVTDGTDSLYIGGTNTLINFNGYIDEVRIIPDVKFTETINDFMFKSIDLANGGAGNYAVYNFDGYAYQNTGNTAPLLNFRGNSGFAHCGAINDQPQSPLNRADNINFQDGYQLKSSFRRIPESGNAGSIMDSINILQDVPVSDINVFVAINHNQEEDLELYLFPPGGGSVQLYNNNTLLSNADNLTTIFDDQADSSLNNGRYVSFSPRIKPYQNINSAITGNSAGIWKLLVRDVTNSAGSDTGVLYGWGIQINNSSSKPYLLNSNVFVQGFYNNATNNMVRDTMRYYLRNTQSPYSIYDSAKSNLTIKGFGQQSFPNASAGVGYYLQLKHRNSIETWSNAAVYFDPLSYQAEYSFTNPVTQAYGNNMLLIDFFPVRYGIISGDINQDGIVDGSDLSDVDNYASVSLSGYVSPDVNGDDFVDATDVSIVDNNVGYEKSVPPGAAPSDEHSDVKEISLTRDPVDYNDPALNFINHDIPVLKDKNINRE